MSAPPSSPCPLQVLFLDAPDPCPPRALPGEETAAEGSSVDLPPRPSHTSPDAQFGTEVQPDPRGAKGLGDLPGTDSSPASHGFECCCGWEGLGQH